MKNDVAVTLKPDDIVVVKFEQGQRVGIVVAVFEDCVQVRLRWLQSKAWSPFLMKISFSDILSVEARV